MVRCRTGGRQDCRGGYANLDGYDFALARYNSNGTLDFSFGTGGKVTTDFAGSKAYTPTAIGADGTVFAINNAVLNAIGN